MLCPSSHCLQEGGQTRRFSEEIQNTNRNQSSSVQRGGRRRRRTPACALCLYSSSFRTFLKFSTRTTKWWYWQLLCAQKPERVCLCIFFLYNRSGLTLPLKALVSRQFVDISRVRLEGLLAAFPKLMSSGKQHTFIETESIRYVYQPLENLYMLLLTNKSSNILEDLETLHLLAKIVRKRSI